MEDVQAQVINLITNAGGKVILALLVYFIGGFVIRKIVKVVGNAKVLQNQDEPVRSIALKALKVILYIVLIMSIIGILGIPMSSLVALLASAGVAVGLAVQGALTNLAGGIMLLILKPFGLGDFVDAGGAEGVVKEIGLFYTTINTPDNKRITVPNGPLMNGNITNYTREDYRRVDLTFNVGKNNDIDKVQNIIAEVMASDEKVLKDPAPFVSASGGTSDSMEFTVRPYCKPEDYWTVYFTMNEKIMKALGAAGVEAPAIRVIQK